MAKDTIYKSIVLMGKITSGKGTQAEMLATLFSCTVFSTGNKVREATTFDTTFGKKMREVYEAGYLIPEWIAEYWMMDELLQIHGEDRVIFEGVAKKPLEAELFHEIHEWLGRPYVVINIEIPDEEVVMRTHERKRDAVDTERIMKTRLDEYQQHTRQSLEIFKQKGKLRTVDGTQSIEGVYESISKILFEKETTV